MHLQPRQKPSLFRERKERMRRARDAAINNAEGEKQQVIKASEAKKQQSINEAEGAARAILSIAEATGEGIRKVADAITVPGGFEAVRLRVAEQYVNKFGELDDCPGDERLEDDRRLRRPRVLARRRATCGPCIRKGLRHRGLS